MKILTGKVIARKMNKVLTVAVERTVIHPLYKKRYRRLKKYHVHDENSGAQVGKVVRFVASRPYAKSVKWHVLAVQDESAPKKAAEKTVKRMTKKTVKKVKKEAKKS